MVTRGSNELLAAFGTAVKEFRISRGMTQEQLAEGAGLHTTYLSDVERGRRNIGIINVERLAAALAIDLGTLLGAVDARRPASRSAARRRGP